MDYVKDLLLAINNYKENSVKTKERLRDLVCFISEQSTLKDDPMICDLLYVASQKMRMFGYNIQNKFLENPDKGVSDLLTLRDESVKNIYRSKVRPNNILDKSQLEVVEFYQSLKLKRMLVSAPTSYGKTFLMREILFLNYEKYQNVLLVFPTVALLQENATEMNMFVKEKELEYKVIKSVDSEIDLTGRNIFVFTPERALQLLANYPDIHLDFFFYDEIYKVDEDYCNDETDEKADDNKESTPTFLDINRGKTFRIALYLLSKDVNDYYLAGPNLNWERFGAGMKRFIEVNHIQVKEINFEPTVRVTVEAFGSKIKEISPIELPSPISNALMKLDPRVNDKICNVAEYIKGNNYGKTLLYCTTPGKANEYASKLALRLNIDFSPDSNRLKMFFQHIRKTYNVNNSVEEWSFVKVLEKGFGLHHGKLPKYIQTEVLQQFNHGAFNILFCTSTIVEGVNTDAQNMVILNAKKGREPLTPFDIKNIKGRAGRYYHSFIGRIFYMNKELLEIEQSSDFSLDFATYADIDLDGIDLDNAEFVDLTNKNQRAKQIRNEKTSQYRITDEIFQKNRLVPKEHQEQLARLLLKDKDQFDQFTPLIHNTDLCENFLKFHYIKKILNTFCRAGLIDESIAKLFSGICWSYYNDGFLGILKFEIQKVGKPDSRVKTIDQAYSNAFKTLKDIIEHKIPKILSLFESIFDFVAKQRGYNVGEFSLSKVKRFYETGVRTSFGEHLSEYGFPLDTIRMLETNFPILLSLTGIQVKNFCSSNKDKIMGKLDAYEQLLFDNAIKILI
ncbi:helicase-related protein [Sporobacter termitidis]|uniref:helicase-related protein n=1 Tax=Sporobacter termitidis TaxID=44749 RepID=UPI000934DE9E|nr:helicase-related protein [Sporobacter termitidis]